MHATPDARQPVAVVIPHEGHLRHALSEDSALSSLSDKPLHDLCTNKNVEAFVLKACNAAGKKNGFKQMELLQGVVLTPDEWTPESGLVTAAQKIQRKKIADTFGEGIKVPCVLIVICMRL